MTTVADQFSESFAAAGVNRITRIVGGGLDGLTDSVPRRAQIDEIIDLAKTNLEQ